MNVGFYDHAAQWELLGDQFVDLFKKFGASTKYVDGPLIKEFEEKFAKHYGYKRVVSCNNGGTAIFIALRAAGVPDGASVITHTNTFAASALAPECVGYRIKLVDCEPEYKCIDPAKVRAALEADTNREIKAIVAVHLYGHLCDMPALRKIADEFNLVIIEDGAQSVGATNPNFKQGELGDAVTTSFIVQKNFGCLGNGGAVMTNNEKIADSVYYQKEYGSKQRSHHGEGSCNFRSEELNMGQLSIKLNHIDGWTANRQALAKTYYEGLKGTSLRLPPMALVDHDAWHLYVIHTQRRDQRDDLLSFLNNNGVDAKTHYPICIHQQIDINMNSGKYQVVGDLSNAEDNAACCVSLPMHPFVTGEESAYVIEKVTEWDRSNN